MTYFAGSGSHQKGELQVTSLPPGNYEVSFMDPKDLQVTMQHQISGGQNLRFDYPAFKKDLVLKIKKIQ